MKKYCIVLVLAISILLLSTFTYEKRIEIDVNSGAERQITLLWDIIFYVQVEKSDFFNLYNKLLLNTNDRCEWRPMSSNRSTVISTIHMHTDWGKAGVLLNDLCLELKGKELYHPKQINLEQKKQIVLHILTLLKNEKFRDMETYVKSLI